MKENSLQYGCPVYNPEDFFGREENIRSIYHQILTLNSISLFGERKIGKTSLLSHLVHLQTLVKYNIPKDFLMVYLDMSSFTFSKSSDVFRKFLECISEKVTGKFKEEISNLLEEKNIYFGKFEEIIKKIKNNNQNIILFLDEFEEILKIKESDIFSRMRYLAIEYDVVFVISTAPDLESLFQEKRFLGSPFLNIFANYPLRGLDGNASRELITAYFNHKNQQIDSSVIETIIKFCGTNPFFLKLYCFFYFEWSNGRLDPNNDLKTIVQSKMEPYHKDNWEHLSRKEQAALIEITKNRNTSDVFAERSLENRGYIARGKDGWNITSESFYNFLKAIPDSYPCFLDDIKAQIAKIEIHPNLSEEDRNALIETVSRIEEKQLHPEELNAPLFELVGYFELEMRKYTRETLETALGPTWLDYALDNRTRKEIEKRIPKEMKKYKNFQYLENTINYALLKDLKDIILRHDNWNLCFSKYFEDREIFKMRMQGIIDLRDTIVHFHPIHLSEAVLIVQNVSWVLNHMRKQVY